MKINILENFDKIQFLQNELKPLESYIEQVQSDREIASENTQVPKKASCKGQPAKSHRERALATKGLRKES